MVEETGCYRPVYMLGTVPEKSLKFQPGHEMTKQSKGQRDKNVKIEATT